MTVFGVVFERHGREFPVVDETSLPGQLLADNPANPCNNVRSAGALADGNIRDLILGGGRLTLCLKFGEIGKSVSGYDKTRMASLCGGAATVSKRLVSEA